jgi:hypothetical protein
MQIGKVNPNIHYSNFPRVRIKIQTQRSLKNPSHFSKTKNYTQTISHKRHDHKT